MLLLLISITGLMLVGVFAVGLFAAGELLLGVAMVGWGLFRPDEQLAAVRRQARDDTTELTTITGFAQTLSTGQTRWALAAHRQGQGMAEDLESALSRLARSGALTPQVRRELVQLTQSHLGRVHALTEEGQAFLVRLAARYDPRAAPQLWLRLVKERWQRRIPV